MPKTTREVAEAEYDAALTSLANGLRALAGHIERTGQAHRHPVMGAIVPVDRVWCASEIHRLVMGWLSSHNAPLMLLWYRAIEAEHAGARSTPAELLDMAATALAAADRDGEGVVEEDDQAVFLAEAALKGRRGDPVSAEVRIVLDRDCPGCDWPEVVAIGASIEAGPSRVECARRRPCGYAADVKEWTPSPRP